MTAQAFSTGEGDDAIRGHERGGDRFPLLLLHGGPGTSDYMDLLDAEVVGWRSITYQQRGLAPSTTTGPFTVARHVTDAAAVLDRLGIERAAVVGHSRAATSRSSSPRPNRDGWPDWC